MTLSLFPAIQSTLQNMYFLLRLYRTDIPAFHIQMLCLAYRSIYGRTQLDVLDDPADAVRWQISKN